MEKREDALREALQENDKEIERWESYQKENETAIENLDIFSKRLTVDVMVPVGRRAYMPGELIHTNELLVGHYQGYFSKCSAYKAKEVCEHRIQQAKDHLDKLNTEAELLRNKLEKPYLEGVVPNIEELEIIEDYDEEKEKQWRTQHKLRLRQAKLEEKQKRAKLESATQQLSTDKSDEDVFKMLEEAEFLEELEKELDALSVDEVNDETIRKLMAGEMALPTEKKRVSHQPKDYVKIDEKNVQRKHELQGVIKKTDLKAKTTTTTTTAATNNNNRPNPELQQLAGNDDDNESVASEADMAVEVQLIKEQAKFLTPADQIGFYEYQIQIMRQKLLTLPLTNQQEIDEKIRLHAVLESLEELLELAEETVGAEELTALEDENKNNDVVTEKAVESAITENTIGKQKQQKRRISFALEDQTLEFRVNETVSQMLPKNQKSEQSAKPQRDIIMLDEPSLQSETKVEPKMQSAIHKKQSIRDKVAQNINYTAEHQCKLDFDLVNQIIDSSESKCRTLHITFQHSTQASNDSEDNVKIEPDFVPVTPADVYKLYLNNLQCNNAKADEPKTLFINSYDGEDQVQTPMLREAARAQAYEDPRLQYSTPNSNTKPILRNKNALSHEMKTDLPPSSNKDKENANKKKKKAPKHLVSEPEYMSAYYKVMNDVVEKPISAPEPLPKCKYIDAHSPKKRVSRFKQMRAGTELP